MLFSFSDSQAVSMLGAVEFQQEKWDGSDQEFILRLCKSILQRLTKMFESFIVNTRIGNWIKVDTDTFIYKYIGGSSSYD